MSRSSRRPPQGMNPKIKLVFASGLVLFALAFSFIMFPRFNDQLQELERNATLTPAPVTGTPSAR